MDNEAEIAFRRELQAAGEAQVRADFYGGGGLSTGGEDRRKVIREWLREQERKREKRDNLTLWFVVGAFGASVAGVVATILHK
jgi:hypothetical protein